MNNSRERADSYVRSLGRDSGTRRSVAATFVSFHVTSYTEGLATAGLGAFVGLLSSVAVAVYAQATRS
jgi:hypothetical protein